MLDVSVWSGWNVRGTSICALQTVCVGSVFASVSPDYTEHGNT